MTAHAAPTTPPAALPDTALAGSSARLTAAITADLAAGEDIRTLLQRFLAPIVQLARAQAGAVRVLDEDGRFRLISDQSRLPALPCHEHSADRHCGACGEAVGTARVAWVDLPAGDAAAPADTAHMARTCQHMLAVPMAHRGSMLGVCNLFFESAQRPSPELLCMLQSIGDLLGLALHNARLEAQTLRATVAQERQMMAAEVHDSVAQDLAFMRMRMPLLEQAVSQHDEPLTARYLQDLRHALGHVHGSLREIVTEYRTPPDPLGLAHALRARMDEVAARSGLRTHLDNRLPTLVLPSAHESQVVHIVGEALANIVRHAQATQAWLTVQAQDGQVHLEVTDDGRGLPATGAARGHHGLDIMAERARRIGGTLRLQPRPDGGTVVALQFALPRTQVLTTEAAT